MEKERKNCHGCGLEDADACEEGKHILAIDTLEPCHSCLRNPRVHDHWDETWTLDEEAGRSLKNKGGENYA